MKAVWVRESDPPAGIEQVTIPGGIDPAPSWDEYVEQHELPPDWLVAIRQAVREAEIERSTGEQYSNDSHFLLTDDDGKQIGVSFTWRAWGDLIQAIEDKREGYVRYYMM